MSNRKREARFARGEGEKEKNAVKVSTPTRIDLAGGTLDIYPLYLFEGSGLTLNVAIDLLSEVELEKRPDQGIRIEAKDLGLVLEASCFDQLKSEGPFARLDLVVRILRFYKPTCGLNVRIESQVPPGSGLGGSSSLLVGLSTALIQLEDLPWLPKWVSMLRASPIIPKRSKFLGPTRLIWRIIFLVGLINYFF